MQRTSQTLVILAVVAIPAIFITLYLSQTESVFPFKAGGVRKEKIQIERVPIRVKVARTAKERERGLSFEQSLKTNEGLLFVFPRDGAHGIWMKNMQFPIDIIWIDSNLRVVDIKVNAVPDSYPEVFYPQRNARYVLEVNALFTELRGIMVGDEVKIPKRALENTQ